MSDPSRTTESHGLITRSRWCLLCLPLLVVAIAAGYLATFLTHDWYYLISTPAVVFGVLLILILYTPKFGLRVGSYSRAMLIWLGSMLALTILLALMDKWILGHGFFEPAKPYHAVACLVVMTITVVGVT